MSEFLTKLKNCAVLIKDEEHSRQVQTELFELGASWIGEPGYKQFRNIKEEVIYVDYCSIREYFLLSYSDRAFYFSDCKSNYPLIELCRGFKDSKIESIEIEGKIYDRSIITDLIKNVKPLY